LIELVAVLLPSWVVTVIVADPPPTAVTSPVVFTVATDVLLDDHVTFLFVAFAGVTVAVSCIVAFTFTVDDVGVTETPVTAIGEPGLLSCHVPFMYHPFLLRFKSAV
jgi:hypothetical protein